MLYQHIITLYYVSNTYPGFFRSFFAMISSLLLLIFFGSPKEGGVSTGSSVPIFFLYLSFFFSFFSLSFLLGLLAWGWESAASCSWTALSYRTKAHTAADLTNKRKQPAHSVSQCISIHPLMVKLFWVSHPPVISHKPPSPFIILTLTCSCNSAKRCCRSWSEAPPEDSDSEELELSSSETAEDGGTCRVEGAGWWADDGVGTGAGSSGSSGILAKRISNTSYWDRGR